MHQSLLLPISLIAVLGACASQGLAAKPPWFAGTGSCDSTGYASMGSSHMDITGYAVGQSANSRRYKFNYDLNWGDGGTGTIDVLRYTNSSVDFGDEGSPAFMLTKQREGVMGGFFQLPTAHAEEFC